MEILNNLTAKIKQLQEQADKEGKCIEQHFYKKFKFTNNKTKVILVNSKFLSIKVGSFEDLTSFLNNCEPYITSHRVKHGNFEHDIINPYRVQIENSSRGYSKLKLTTYLINNFMIWVEIDFNLLPYYIIDKYTNLSYRNVTDSEYHYFTGYSMKRLRELKIPARRFNGYQLSWYGGDKTLLSHDKNTVYSSVLDNLINELKYNTNKEQY